MDGLIAFFKNIGTGAYVAAAVVLVVIFAMIRMYFSGRAASDADAAAAGAKNEARKVKKAGKSGDAEAVLDSFRRATDRKRK